MEEPGGWRELKKGYGEGGLTEEKNGWRGLG